MAIQAEHKLHRIRRSRNIGLGLVLVGFVCVVFGLTVVKMQELGSLQGYDHVVQPQLLPEGSE